MSDMQYKRIAGGYYAPGTPEYKDFLKELGPLSQYTSIHPSHGIPVPENKYVSPQDYIPARRANPLNKYGAKDKMETQDYGYDKDTIGRLLNAYRDAVQLHGIPKMSADDLTNMALVEGRSNFGYNEFNQNNKKANAIAQDLIKRGHDPYAAGFPAAILDKHMQSQRLNVPFYQLWNGSGKEARDYAKRIEQQRYAVEHPKNQPLRNYIKGKLGALEMDQKVSEMEPEEIPMKRGGGVRMPENYSQGNWKLI